MGGLQGSALMAQRCNIGGAAAGPGLWLGLGLWQQLGLWHLLGLRSCCWHVLGRHGRQGMPKLKGPLAAWQVMAAKQ